jgi:hypothetical protein
MIPTFSILAAPNEYSRLAQGIIKANPKRKKKKK